MAALWTSVLAVMATIIAVAGDCPDDWLEYRNNSCFYGSDFELTWQDARQICMQLQPTADLASVHNLQEESFIDEHFPGYRWLGLNDIELEGTFVWANGDAVDYTIWICLKPNNGSSLDNCVHIGSYGHWNDNVCDTHYKFVCKMASG